MRHRVGFILVLTITSTFAAAVSHARECGDVNDSGQITAADALLLLRKAVDLPVSDLVCPAGGILATGQVTCYDAAASEIDCAGTGQDGDVRAGAAREFSDDGEGMIADAVTNLVWETLSDDDSIHDKDHRYTWTSTVSKVGTLNEECFGGHGDWRLPNVFELESLVHHGVQNPAAYPEFDDGCAAECTVLTCSCTAAAPYWSSTSYVADPSRAWSVSFADGDSAAEDKTVELRARAVRGGVPATVIVTDAYADVAVPGSFTLRQTSVDVATITVFVRSPLPPFDAVLLVPNVNYSVQSQGDTYAIVILSLPPEFVVPGTYDFEASYAIVRDRCASTR